jgi:type I restriction enzyme S subunit
MSEVAQVPQLRFPEFSGEWEDGKLGNYGNLINGLTYSPDNIVDDGLLVLRSSNVQNGQIYLNDNVYVNLDVDDAALTKEDDILICVRNGSKRLIGKSTIINKNLPKSTHGAFMTVFRGESNKFISHWFHSSIYYKEVHKNLGATINSINGSNLKKFKTIFPLKPEQQKIAAFLTAVDTKIEQLSKKQELLGEYKKGLMQQIFSQAIRFKADDGSDFPDWIEKKLGDVSIRGASNISANQLEDNNGGYKIYGAAGHLKNIDFYTEEDCYVAIVKDGAGAGRIMLLEAKTSVLGTLAIIKAKQGNDINFLYWLIQTINFRKYVVGSTIPHIYYRDYQAENLRIPSLSEQTKIANFLSSIDTKIKQVGKQLNESKQFKKALLQQMFV